MGSFAANAITENGRSLLADLQAGAVFIPTKIVIGSGSIPSGKTAATMTAVSATVKELAINKIQKTGDGKAIIGGVYTNKDITTDFYFRELALFARAEYRDASGAVTKAVSEVLYSYGNAGDTADLMPAYSTNAVIEKQIDLVCWVGQGASVALTIESGVYVTQEQIGANGGIVALGDDGNVNLKGGTVTGLKAPTNNSDAATKEYADKMLPKSGGTMNGAINMGGKSVSNLPAPSADGDAARKKYVDDKANEAAAKGGSPFNYANNSDFTNPVKRSSATVFAYGGETIDNWFAYDSNLRVTVTGDGYLLLSNTGTENSYLAQKDIAHDLEYGKTYTCVAWFHDGTRTVQHVKTRAGINSYSDKVEKGLQFAISDVASSYKIIMYISGGATVGIKHVAVYEGEFTVDNCPGYCPRGYYVEELNVFGGGRTVVDLLWANTDTTVAFEEQLVEIDYSKYSFLYILFKASTTIQDETDCFLCVKELATQRTLPVFVDGDGVKNPSMREVRLDLDGVKFYTGKRVIYVVNSSTNSLNRTFGDNNEYAIPRKIYGIR